MLTKHKPILFPCNGYHTHIYNSAFNTFLHLQSDSVWFCDCSDYKRAAQFQSGGAKIQFLPGRLSKAKAKELSSTIH